MTLSILTLLGGVFLAWLGAVLFVGGAVGLARWARWPAAVIGVTVAAFGTSAPELMVAIHSAADGVPEISLGDVLGSNVVNITLILAIVIAAGGLKAGDDGLRRDWAVALAVPFVLLLLLLDGWFSRWDALILMAAFGLWLWVVVRHARRHSTAAAAAEGRSASSDISAAARRTGLHIAGQVIAGLALLVGAAQLVVHGGRSLAELLGFSPLVVGVVVVSVATSTPELATTIISRIRGHDDVGLGNIVGSNIFNALFIAAAAALVRPYAVKVPEIIPSLAFGAISTLLILPGPGGYLGRWRGFALLGFYVAFVILSLTGGSAAH